MHRVYRILNKGKQLRELEKFIHKTGETGFTHAEILRDLAEVAGSKVETRYLTLAQIETFAKQFYGFTEQLERKLAKDQKQAAFFAMTAKNARARRDKSRTNKKSKEVQRISEAWGLPEIANAKDVKHARMVDKDLSWAAERGFKPVKICMFIASCLGHRTAGLSGLRS